MLKMASRFQLHCDGVAIRNVQELKQNFNIDDVLSNFKNNILQNWLEARGFTEELKKVSAISLKQDDRKIAYDLAKAFGINCQEQDVKQILNYHQSSLSHIAEIQKRLNDTLDTSEETKEEVDDDNGSMLIPTKSDEIYRTFVKDLIDNRKYRDTLRQKIDTFLKDHFPIFKIVYLDLIRILSVHAPLALLLLFADERTKAFYYEPDESVLLLADDEDCDKERAIKQAKANLDEALLQYIGFSREKNKGDKEKFEAFIERLDKDGILTTVETNIPNEYAIVYPDGNRQVCNIFLLQFNAGMEQTHLYFNDCHKDGDKEFNTWGKKTEIKVSTDNNCIIEAQMLLQRGIELKDNQAGLETVKFCYVRLD